MKKFFFTLAAIFGLWGTSVSAQNTTQVVDGVSYQAEAAPSQGPEMVRIGETRRIGERCQIVQKDFWHNANVCTWKKTITNNQGKLVIGGAGKTVQGLVNHRALALIAISFMALAMIFFWKGYFGVAIAASIAFAIAVAIGAVFATAVVVAAVFAASIATATAAFATAAEAKKLFWWSAGIFQILMVAALFL